MTRKRNGFSELVLIPSLETLRPPEAKVILDMRLSPEVVDRVDELSKATKRRELTIDESEELDFYLDLGSLLTIMHSKARLAMKRNRSREPRRKSA